MGTQRRRRNKRTLAAREALWADFFKWCNSEGILNHQDDKRAAARYVATDLVADTGDVLLEVLVVTATESVSRPKRDLRKDEGRLTEAIGSVESVKSCWLFLAWSMAARSAAHADGADAALDASIHEDLARLIDALWPRSPDDEQTLDTAFRAEELGYWTLEWVLTRQAFSYLLGDEVDQLTLFKDLDPALDLRLLSLAWDIGRRTYESAVETMATS